MLATLLILSIAPTLEGGPRLRTDVIGGGLSQYGGRFAIKAALTGGDEDKLGAFGFYDTRSGRSRDATQGVFSIEVRDASGARLRTGRHVSFDPHGWFDSATDGALMARVRVSTLSRNLYLAKLTLTGVPGPLTVTGRVDGTVATGATYDNGLVTVDNANRPPFGLALGTRSAGPTSAGTTGTTYSATTAVMVTADGDVDFLLAFDETPANARTVLMNAPASAAALPWVFALGQRPDQRYFLTEVSAFAILANGEVLAPNGDVLGGAAAKSHYNELWVWDSSFHALGVSEWDAMRAFAHLEGVYRGQVATGTEAGMLYNHVDEAGQPVRLAVPGYTDEFSQAPAIGFAMREVYDRSAKDDEAKAKLQRSFDVSGPYLDWWTKRRDKDGDGLAEFNGGWESGWDNSPRFTEIWGQGLVPRFAAEDADTRARLNCVDLNAWLYLYLVEMARSSERLGRSDAKTWRDKADALAKKIDDNFWVDADGVYVDYVVAGGRQRFEKARTAVTIWPLFAGSVRDLDRAKKVIDGTLLNPAKLWGQYGIPSVAFDDPEFAAADYWRGPVWINVSYAAMIALFRYGYEAEAEELRKKTLDLVASDHGIWEYYDAKTGAGLNAYQFGWSGALFIEALRNRHQAEAYAVGEKREGEIHRLMRLSDGVTLAEVSVEGTFEVPTTKFEGTFDGPPVKLTFSDPAGVIGSRMVTVSFPGLSHMSITAKVGDTVTVSDYQARGCGCGAAPGGVLVALLLLLRRKR